MHSSRLFALHPPVTAAPVEAVLAEAVLVEAVDLVEAVPGEGKVLPFLPVIYLNHPSLQMY